MENQMKQIKKMFVKNFSNLKSNLFDLNIETLKISASFEYEGEFTEPELIVNVFEDIFDQKEVENMLQMFKDNLFEDVKFKSENDDYFIFAGCPEAIFVLKLQIFRIK